MNTEYISKERALDFIRQAYGMFLPQCHGAIMYLENAIGAIKPAEVLSREESTLQEPHDYYIEPGHTRLGVGYTEDQRPRFVVQVGTLDCRKHDPLPKDEKKMPVFGMNFYDLKQFKIFADNLEMAYETLKNHKEEVV